MTDTSPEAAAIQLDLLRKMGPEGRMRLAFSWSTSLRNLIRESLRKKNPGIPEEALEHLLARRWLGDELAEKAFPTK